MKLNYLFSLMLLALFCSHVGATSAPIPVTPTYIVGSSTIQPFLNAQEFNGIFLQKTPALPEGKNEYTVYFKNTYPLENAALMVVQPTGEYAFVCSISHPCSNPQRFTSDLTEFDLLFFSINDTDVPVPHWTDYAVMIRGVHGNSEIKFDQSLARHASVPNAENFFVDLIGRPPSKMLALVSFNRGSELVAPIGYDYGKYGLFLPFLYAENTLKNDYQLELAFGGAARNSDLSEKVLFASVAFTHPFSSIIEPIPPGISEKNYAVYPSLTNPLVSGATTSQLGSTLMLETIFWGLRLNCDFPSGNRDCSIQGSLHYWQEKDKVLLNALVGHKTRWFELQNVQWDVSGTHYGLFAPTPPCNSFQANQFYGYTNQSNGSLMKSPYKLNVIPYLFETNPPTHPHPGIVLHAIDAYNSELWFGGNYLFDASFVRVNTPTGRNIEVRGLNGGSYDPQCPPASPRPFILSCGEYWWDLLGQCELGNYAFYFDATGVFLGNAPCLTVRASFDGINFNILSQEPGFVKNGRCITNIVPTAIAVDSNPKTPKKSGAVALASSPPEQNQDYLPYWVAGTVGLLVVVGALAWRYKTSKKR